MIISFCYLQIYLGARMRGVEAEIELEEQHDEAQRTSKVCSFLVPLAAKRSPEKAGREPRQIQSIHQINL